MPGRSTGKLWLFFAIGSVFTEQPEYLPTLELGVSFQDERLRSTRRC
jgi:hypothetical protein